MNPYAALDGMDSQDPRKWQLAEHFAHTVGAQFLQGHQLVQKRSDNELELRGNWQHLPARLKIDMSFNSLEWEMKAPNPTNETIYLHFEEDAVPNVGQFSGAAASAWDDDNESVKTFFGRGFYMECDRRELDKRLAIYQSLHEHVRKSLAAYMVGDRLRRLYIYSYGNMLLGFKDDIDEVPDPVGLAGRAVWLMGQVAWGLSQLGSVAAPTPGVPTAMMPVHKMTCGYCRTLYLWSQNQTCPNCGAPPRG